MKENKHSEGSEYFSKDSKRVVPNSLKFTAIMFLILGLIMPFVTYSQWYDLNKYENGGDIKIQEIIWWIYQIGGSTHGKWLVSGLLAIASPFFLFKSSRYWKEYRLVKEEFKNS